MVITILLRFYDRQKGGGDIFFYLGGWAREVSRKPKTNQISMAGAGCWRGVCIGWLWGGLVLGVWVCVRYCRLRAIGGNHLGFVSSLSTPFALYIR